MSEPTTVPVPEVKQEVAQVTPPVQTLVLPDRPFDEKTASLVELKEVARLFAGSSTFKGVSNPATAFALMLVGRDLGLSMTKALTDVTMIQGKPTLSASLMAGMIKASGKYRLIKKKHDENECIIEVRERVDGKWEVLGESSFSIKDAERAVLLKNDVWKKFPRNMVWSRCISNIARQECGDVFLGSVYTPDELQPDMDFDDEGNPITKTTIIGKPKVSVVTSKAKVS